MRWIAVTCLAMGLVACGDGSDPGDTDAGGMDAAVTTDAGDDAGTDAGVGTDAGEDVDAGDTDAGPGCEMAAECDDLDPCNGIETCTDGACVDGTPVVDGTEWEQADGPLTGVVSAVFQDFARYEMTVAENVWLGAPWRDAEDAAIDEALRRAGADGVLGNLPEGLESRLGRRFEGGLDLSIGQWQRLALARAFFSPAGFLVLDEPTASLDPKVEADLFDRLHELCEGRGVLLISHRFSTVKSADRIVVLDQGRVAEQGTHDELMASGGVYAALYRLQADRYST